LNESVPPVSRWPSSGIFDRFLRYHQSLTKDSATLCEILLYCTYKSTLLKPLNQETNLNVVTKDTKVVTSPNEKLLFAEQLSRNCSFFGADNLECIKSSFVVVVGAGGVGSWAALMLIRSGVQRIRLIDFDQVTLSSLNRHAVAIRSDVGMSKVEAMRKRFLEIVPHIKIDTRVELFSKDNQEELLSGTMPAIFGMVMATRVLTELGNFPTEPLAIKGRHALYVRLHRDLMHREGAKTKIISAISLTVEEIGYIFEEMWMGKSAISNAVDKLSLVRYYADKPLSSLNCVCMTKKEADKHCKLDEGVDPDTYYDKAVVDYIHSRFEIERLYASLPDKFP
ncbi:tRNA threonylcarbamoyladenosine dehydratase, partial [Smittium culicis]